MASVSLEEAQSQLRALVHALRAGDEVVITENGQEVARIVPPVKPERRLGTLRGSVLYMAPDFDAPLEDFKDYMR